MRILEIICESVESENTSNAEDLLYLLDNTDMRPEELAVIASELKKIAGENDDISDVDQSTAPGQQTEPLDQIEPEEPVTAEPETEEPVDTPDNVDNEIQERVENQKTVKKKKTVTKQSYREQIEQYLNQVTDDNQLKGLVYNIHIAKFKDLAKKIVDNKIKSKAKEIYKAIESLIPNLGDTVEVSLMTDFLNDCLTTGVIDTPAMISGSATNNRILLSNDQYEPIIKAFLGLTLPGGAAIGGGEIGIAFAGIDTTKEATDIKVGELDIEVKASRDTNDFFMKGIAGGGFANQKKGVKELVKYLNNAGANFKESNEVGKGGIAQLNNATTRKLQPYFKKMGQEKTVECIVSVLKAIHRNSPEMVDQYKEEIASAINEDGIINYELLCIPTAKLNFDYYKAMSGHDGVLMLNIDSFTYFYATDSESFANLTTNGALKQISAIDFRTNSLGGLAYFVNPIQLDY
jgi:hypothetical protein